MIKKQVFLRGLVMMFACLTANNSLGSSSQENRGDQVPGTCEEVAIELARFSVLLTEWGSTNEGDPSSRTRHSSTEGEWFADGVTVYKSRSRFTKRVRQVVKDSTGLSYRTLLLDENGHEIGQRIVKETRVDGKVTRVFILRIRDRTIRFINAPSMKLALTVEKANNFCRAEAERSQKSR